MKLLAINVVVACLLVSAVLASEGPTTKRPLAHRKFRERMPCKLLVPK